MTIESDLTAAIRAIVQAEVKKQLAPSPGAARQQGETSPTKFFFCAEAAAELRRTEAAVRWLWQSGALKSRVVGGRRVSTQADLDEFFAGSAS